MLKLLSNINQRFIHLAVKGISVMFGILITTIATASESELSINLGQLNGYLDNRLGGNMQDRYINSIQTVNDNRLLLQLRSDLIISDIVLNIRAGNARYRLRVLDTVSRNETVAKDSIWSSSAQRDYYSESVSKARFGQWEVAVANRYNGVDYGAGIEKTAISFYNHDGVERYDLVPGYAVVQDGSVLDYSIWYLMPYFSVAYPFTAPQNKLEFEVSLQWSPWVSAAENETHYWRGYRAGSDLSGSGYKFNLQSAYRLDSRTRLNLIYTSSQLSLSGQRSYEDYDIITIDQRQTLRQWGMLLGLTFLL